MRLRSMAWASVALFAASLQVFAQDPIFFEDFSTDGDGVRYTMVGRGSDTSPDAWDHTFSLAQSATFPLGPGGEITLAANRIAIPWQSTVETPTDNAIPFFDSAVNWATNGGSNLNVSFMVNDNPSAGSLASGDAAVFGRLGEMGHNVNLFSATSISPAALETTDLLLISDSVTEADIYKSINIREATVPVVNYSAGLADDLLLTSTSGSVRQLSSMDIKLPFNPAAPAGLDFGQQVAISTEATSMPEYGFRREGVDVLATWYGPFARNISGLETVDAMIDGRAGSLTGVETFDIADLFDSDGGDGDFANDGPNIPLPDSPDFTQEPGGLNQYAVVSRGTITVSEAGDYVFGLGGDDGGRLRINGENVIVDDSFHGFTWRTATATLPEGDHEIEWVGFEGGGGSGFELAWIPAADFTGNPGIDFPEIGDLISTDPINDAIVLKDPGLEVTAHFIAPELGPDVVTNNPAMLAASAGTTFRLPSEPFENPTGDYILGTDMDSIPGNSDGRGVLLFPAEGGEAIDLSGVSNPKLSMDVAATFSLEEDDAIVVFVNGDEIARLQGNEMSILADQESGQLFDSNFRTVTWDLPSGISEIESLEIEVGAISSSGEAVGIDQIRITDGDPTDVKVVVFPENRIQQGENGYEGLEDTEIRFSDPDADLSEKLALNPDGADGGGEVHGLTRFNDIIGDGENQIPADANVESATLNINIVGPGTPLALHRMLVAWEDDTASWNEFGGGIQADDMEALAIADDVQTANTGVTSWDITDSIKAWQEDPDSNFGWVMLPQGTNGVDYLSAEGVNLETGDLAVAPWIDFFLSSGPDFDCNGDGVIDITDANCTTIEELDEFLAALDIPSLRGDANGDGTVNVQDFLVLSRNFNSGTQYTEGDFNLDGSVNVQDFLVISRNFNKSGVAAAAVPEPTGFILGLFALVGLTLRRRRG